MLEGDAIERIFCKNCFHPHAAKYSFGMLPFTENSYSERMLLIIGTATRDIDRISFLCIISSYDE